MVLITYANASKWNSGQRMFRIKLNLYSTWSITRIDSDRGIAGVAAARHDGNRYVSKPMRLSKADAGRYTSRGYMFSVIVYKSSPNW